MDEGDMPEVRVSVRLDYNVETVAEVDRLRADLQLDLQAEGNAVAVTARNPRETGFRFSWQEQVRMEINFRIVVPRQCHLTLKTARGNITVGRVAGRMAAEVEQGSIYFRQVDGSVVARARNGNIVISRCSGTVAARTLQGSIGAGTLGEPAELKTANGGIEVLVARHAVTAQAEAVILRWDFPGPCRNRRKSRPQVEPCWSR
ncbi:MAG: hypothetical protein EXS43_05945 [Opitutus sp.]|nr:hypothetical protein [Opitutus sp.]